MKTLQEQLKAAREDFDALAPGEHSERAKRCVAALGAWHRALGQWDDALTIFDHGQKLCEEGRDEEGVSEFLTWKSNTYYHKGQYARAIEFAVKAIERSQCDFARAGRRSYYLALPYLMLGDVDRFVALQQEALALLPEEPVRQRERREAWFLCKLAKGLHLQGIFTEARALATQQVERFRALNPRYGLPSALLTLGPIELSLGNLDGAEHALREALSLYQSNRQEAFIVDAVTELSKVALARGEAEGAAGLAEKAVGEARRGPRMREGLADTRHLNAALVQSARAHLQAGGKAAALDCYEEALSLAVATNRRLILADLLELRDGLAPEGVSR